MSDPSTAGNDSPDASMALPPEILLLERADFVGVGMSQMLYGITIVLFFQCMIALLGRRRGATYNPLLAGYTFLLFSFNTVFVAMNMHNSRLAYIDHDDFPGGPALFTLSRYSMAIAVVPNAAFILSNWLADGLLLYRTKVIWQNQLWILILPVIMYLASISMGIMTIFQSSRPNASLWTSVTVDFGLPYFSISVSLNVLLTLLILLRLWFHNRSMKQTASMSASRSATPYASIISMLVESSALYAVTSLLFIGSYGAGNNISALFLPILGQTQVIAPLLIISRVARQRAFGSTPSSSSGGKPSPSSPGSERTKFTIGSIPMEETLKFTSPGTGKEEV
ncbi:hypothetical protein CCMSSC00406_0006583 [Pleurotus cornucopiae]|uniref:Uncharacterized protein n=1 Tax=Pleurotus cornucopiae TaxID=5321 RepID=A0ACB7IXB3_PLECO|nr:hypothetical protein CCMSSC00406_0006583 [Pleurotus cornucopiae]